MLITKELAHVTSNENLFVHEVNPSAVPNRYESEFTVDGTHPYLYENQAIANHVSGTSFLDTCRQLLKSITHLFYGVPLDNRFVIQAVSMEFTRWAKLHVPIQAVVDCETRNVILRRRECLTFTGTITFHQENRQLGTMTGRFTTFPLDVEQILMERQYSQPAAKGDETVGVGDGSEARADGGGQPTQPGALSGTNLGRTVPQTQEKAPCPL